MILGDSLSERLRADDSHRPGPHTCRQLQGEFAAAMGGAFIHSVGGDGVEHVLFRLLLTFDLCFAASVSTVVVLVGINNLLGAPQKRAGVEAEGATASSRARWDHVRRSEMMRHALASTQWSAVLHALRANDAELQAAKTALDEAKARVEKLDEEMDALQRR